MIQVTTSGNTKNADAFLQRMVARKQFEGLERYGPIGVQALSAATPEDSGETADSWYYEVVSKPGYFAIHWSNSNMEDGISIAGIIQSGHGTGTGAFIQGIDYINPALRPIFEQIVSDMWKEVIK
jgi:hypothetical protein